jgi:hypothetical protein
MLSFPLPILPILILIVSEEAFVFLAIYINLRVLSSPTGGGLRFLAPVSSYCGLALNCVATCGATIAACVLSKDAKHEPWVMASVQSACISLLAVEVSVVMPNFLVVQPTDIL